MSNICQSSTDSSAQYLITFQSTFYVMKAEQMIRKAGNIPFKLIPTPREISSECGFSLLISDIPSSLQGLESIYRLIQNDQGVVYEKEH